MPDATVLEVSCAVPSRTGDTSDRLTPSLALLRAVADPVRWTVLQHLAAGESCVCDIQERVPIAANLLSYHLKVLREAGLVVTSRRGRWIDYCLAVDALERLHAALPGSGVPDPMGSGPSRT